MKEYVGHIRDSRKTDPITQQPYAICGEKILDFSHQSIDHAYHSVKDGDAVPVCHQCWIRIEIMMKFKH